MISEEIHIRGLVQGVGFRPFVYRIAKDEGILGEVENRNDGVYILVSAPSENIDSFLSIIQDKAPPASRIDTVERRVLALRDFDDFRIVKSEIVSDSITGVSPDISTCDECLADMKSQQHRLDYPFINCTNCGPRFTIIKELPYDRENTTMDPFIMCDTCRSEYENVLDRRFHAQPVACNNCGPHYFIEADEDQNTDIHYIVDLIIQNIKDGKIVALKGTGGYHLICDACSDSAVDLLRRRKGREGKPLAVMCENIDNTLEIAYVSDEERILLESWQRPIVLLKSKEKLAGSVSKGLNTVGVVLPYMPIHKLIFEKISSSKLVFTSANFSDEPIVTGSPEGLEKLSAVADIIVSYNREIHNRTDDSVAKLIANKPVLLRRSRAYAPSSVQTTFSVEGIFAAGPELVNTFAIGKGKEVIMSQYIGDLKNTPTLDFYRESYRLLSKLYRFKPQVIVRDLHPDYLSSRFAEDLALESSVPIVSVQHHHAHIASCMAENKLDGKMIGLSLDGVGLGSDGNIWGGEVLLAGYSGFERLYHFENVSIVGSDRVSEEPWRSGLAYLLRYVPDSSVIMDVADKMKVKASSLELFSKGIDLGINSHYYSSAGRLFDAVASIIGVNTISDFHAEAPMRLESVLDASEKGYYDYSLERDTISFGPTIEQLVEDMLNGVRPGAISARFHRSVVNALVETVSEVSQSTGIKTVVLSGGTFQNSYLTDNLFRILKKYSYEVYLHGLVPPNDGGLALGQMAIAAHKMMD
jgi:hydrogenase maturation protein HypF